MDTEQIREIVKITLEELEKRGQYRPYNYSAILQAVEGKLYSYFNNKDNSVSCALRAISDDQYIDIIFFHYRDGRTLEWIAEYYKVDVSTIKRNKKRLITKIYELMEDYK